VQREGGLLDDNPRQPKHSTPVKELSFASSRAKRTAAAVKGRRAERERVSAAKRAEAPEFPSVSFTVAEEGISENHRIFVAHAGDGNFQLMIASYPLPVAAFILEMRARFNKLVAEANKGLKKPRGLAQSGVTFTGHEAAANAELATANGVFGNALANDQQKRAAEQQLAVRLDPLIRHVIQFATRLGQHFSVPGNAPMAVVTAITSPLTNAPDPGYYVNQIGGAAERYAVEGMVAHYQDLPDYAGSGFERDHQPHNDLIETMASLPEFAGKRMQTVAAGRTLQGWAIMLQHNRHAAGRTFGNLGGTVTAQFSTDLANHRLALGAAATPAAIRQFCIDYLVQSMKDDVAAMKAVANDDNNYADMNGMKAGDKATHRGRVKAQVRAGEDRILATEASIRTYDQ
jgi:hypothetical protein